MMDHCSLSFSRSPRPGADCAFAKNHGLALRKMLKTEIRGGTSRRQHTIRSQLALFMCVSITSHMRELAWSISAAHTTISNHAPSVASTRAQSVLTCDRILLFQTLLTQVVAFISFFLNSIVLLLPSSAGCCGNELAVGPRLLYTLACE